MPPNPNPGATPAVIAEAVSILRRGGVVVFPTETVYGLGADALSVAAVRRVFTVKGRPADHPLIVHLAAADALDDWARQVPDAARELARTYWPGPLTLVLPRRPHVPDAVTGGQDSVALRVPAHPLALPLIAAAGALVAPSANRFGRVSPTTAAHVRDELGDAVDLVIDGGPCAVGVESTIVSLLGAKPVLLRPGAIAPAQIETTLGETLGLGDGGVRVPGALSAHYAPATPLELVERKDLDARVARLAERGVRLAVLRPGDPPPALPPGVQWMPMPGEADAYARALYATLRAADVFGHDVLLVEMPPDRPAWMAVRDRLGRAARTFAAADGPTAERGDRT
ncbi:MAG: threonylcarbamoyl-AMP synthase [Hydrogenophilales bacterium 17-64-11]|nr:MAG: threonylcarbamoyl-AMP synthase [Hydrogenophilales bacterium 17-64-11]